MNRKILVEALMVSIAVLASSAAHAQSNVTLYGRINNGIQFQTGLPHGNTWSAESGGFGESWIGFLGSEDLGGGTHAIFHLETGLNTETGSIGNGGLFARAATVGLKSDSLGTLNLGNMGAGEVQQDTWFVDPQFMQAFAIQTLVRGRNWSQAGNGFEYTSPALSGLTVKGQYELTNTPGNWNGTNGGGGSQPSNLGTPQGRSDGVKVQYDGANMVLLAIYDEIRNQNGQFSNVYVASRSATAGGTYTIGPVRLYAGFQHLSAPDASNASYFIPATAALPGGTSVPTAVNHEWAGAEWTALPAVTLTGAIYHANANNGNGNATLYTLTGSYALSKRTSLYTEFGYIHNSSTSNIGLGNGYSDPYGPNVNNDPVNGGANGSPNYGHGEFGAFAGISTQF